MNVEKKYLKYRTNLSGAFISCISVLFIFIDIV